MSRLADLIRSGAIRSAWDEYDSEEDAFAGRPSSARAEIIEAARLEQERYTREREEVERRHAILVKAQIEYERQKREAAAMVELEAVDGFGSF